MPKKLFIICGLFLICVVGFFAFGIRYVKTHPEKITSFIEQVTLPYKIAKLASQEPDATILMPVYGTKVSGITDTWGAPRGNDRTHEGQDIFATKGTPVFSGTSGYVLYKGDVELGGNAMYIIGSGARRYYYAHLGRFADGIHIGQSVTPDTVIGYVGNTGNAETTPPHLHFGMYAHREALNPLPLLVNR